MTDFTSASFDLAWTFHKSLAHEHPLRNAIISLAEKGNSINFDDFHTDRNYIEYQTFSAGKQNTQRIFKKYVVPSETSTIDLYLHYLQFFEHILEDGKLKTENARIRFECFDEDHMSRQVGFLRGAMESQVSQQKFNVLSSKFLKERTKQNSLTLLTFTKTLIYGLKDYKRTHRTELYNPQVYKQLIQSDHFKFYVGLLTDLVNRLFSNHITTKIPDAFTHNSNFINIYHFCTLEEHSYLHQMAQSPMVVTPQLCRQLFEHDNKRLQTQSIEYNRIPPDQLESLRRHPLYNFLEILFYCCIGSGSPLLAVYIKEARAELGGRPSKTATFRLFNRVTTMLRRTDRLYSYQSQELYIQTMPLRNWNIIFTYWTNRNFATRIMSTPAQYDLKYSSIKRDSPFTTVKKIEFKPSFIVIICIAFILLYLILS